jgi:hypothetical protein
MAEYILLSSSKEFLKSEVWKESKGTLNNDPSPILKLSFH